MKQPHSREASQLILSWHSGKFMKKKGVTSESTGSNKNKKNKKIKYCAHSCRDQLVSSVTAGVHNVAAVLHIHKCGACVPA